MRPTKPTLNHAYIASVALALIDRVGLGKFSMRKLGAELGVDPMAVYYYYRDQESLFDGVAEALFDELDADAVRWESSWRELCEEFFTRLRDTLLAHPHAVSIFATRPVRSRAAIESGERAIGVLCEAGFTPALALQLTRCLREFTIGHAQSVAAVRLGAGLRSRKPEPGAPDYNLLARSADAADIDAHFGVGLRAMLDGFERLAD
ncbi:TetR/AcrR family transcriptional regulator C-terminal domain-containing protein [Nonomuraea sp. NPDC000554]|uniref:TetR/AcrR family transcriptional regulator C-terminal domain-containing protein n=1 Tax=Nonomuraea sp. NPDC000554 TaxID=3154259 RepID=UPI003320C96F